MVQRCLGGSQSGYWYPEGGATDIIQALLVAEFDAGRVATVFAADSDF